MEDKAQEEKLIETTLDMLIMRVQDLKNSLSSFIFKLEQEQPTWPQMLDNFAVLAGQINNLNKLMKDERMPTFRNFVLFPILVSLDRDEALETATEGRIQAFSHEVVPDSLRTKYEPEVEKEEARCAKKAMELSKEEAQRQIDNLNELASTMEEMISSAREDWESENAVKDVPVTPSAGDTRILINAMTNGAGLRRKSSPQTADQQGSSVNLSAHGKAKSSVKSGVRPHPYSGNTKRTAQK